MGEVSRRDGAAMVGLVAAGAAATIAFAERIGVNGGEGWDGRAYAAWARDFTQVLHGGVTRYQAQRVAPSAAVYYAHQALGVAPTRGHVIVSFQILDGIALACAAWFLYRIARALAWPRAAAWAAYASAFLAFANARHALYYPTLTDAPAFALGTALVWAFLERRAIATAVIALLSTVTWPALVPLALAALVCPRPAEPPPALELRGHRAAAALAVGAATAALVAVWLLWYWHAPYPGRDNFYAHAHGKLIGATVAIAAGACAWAAHAFARDGRTWAIVPYLRALPRRRLAAGAAAAIAIVALQAWWTGHAGGAGPGITLGEYIGQTAAVAVRGPGWALVFLVVYFGPIALIAMVAWRRIAAHAAALGPAMVAAGAMTVLLSVTTESRQLLHVWPFVIVLAIEATRAWWTPRTTAVLAVLALAWSKVWWKFGYDRALDVWGWPNQRYIMHEGPWACDASYLAHLAAAAVTAGVLALALRSSAGARREA